MSIKDRIIAQFRKPTGTPGHLAGLLMSKRRSNIERNRWTLDLLDIQPDNNVLEVGFGPGVAIQMLAQRLSNGHITGIDHSQTMLHQASSRNRAAINQGKVELWTMDVNAIKNLEKQFDKIYSVNVYQFWKNPARSFQMLSDVLSPGGQLATTFMPRLTKPTIDELETTAKEIENSLKPLSFSRINLHYNTLAGDAVICVIATK